MGLAAPVSMASVGGRLEQSKVGSGGGFAKEELNCI